MTKIMFDLAVIAPIAHIVTVNAGLLASSGQSAAGVLIIVSCDFLQYRVSSIPIIIIIIAPLCMILHLLQVIYYSH